MPINYITYIGAKKLKFELHKLKTIERPKITKLIAEARSHGDLSENAEYDYARDKQRFLEHKIKNIENALLNSKIINYNILKNKKAVLFGATVKIKDLKLKKILQYQIVGDMESDLNNNKISILSPMAKSLLGKSIGEIIYVDSPSGINSYKIVNILYI